VKYFQDIGIIHSVYTGEVTADDFKEATIKAISMSKNYKANSLLIDNSKQESTMSTVEIYKIPELYDNVYASQGSRMAFSLPSSRQISNGVAYYATLTLCQSFGWIVKDFIKRQEAFAWLLPNHIPEFLLSPPSEAVQYHIPTTEKSKHCGKIA